MSVATTAAGKFSLLNPNPEEVNWLVVANAISKICRFAGNTRGHYSVAEHSVRLADAIARAGGNRAEQLQALVHDAHEAFCGDITRPMLQAVLKLNATAYNAIKEIERRCQEAVFIAAGCDTMLEARVMHFDIMLGNAEATVLIGCERPDISQFVWDALTAGDPIGWDYEHASIVWLDQLNKLQS